jgi:hypothetical protein
VGDYFAARHNVSDEGLRYSRLVGSGGYIRWTEVKKVQFSDAMKWFRLESQSGEAVRISIMLMGLPEFAWALLAHTPRESIEKVRYRFCEPRLKKTRRRFGEHRLDQRLVTAN